MDKLEKALEKARLQRDATIGSEASAQSTLRPRADAGASTREVSIAADALDRNRLVARLGGSRHADTFRMLRTKVLQALTKSEMRAVAVTSPRYGDGKTTIALNLALSLAMDLKQTVLLVDLDLRHPGVHRYLELQSDTGLSDYLLRGVPVSRCLVKPGVERLVILPGSESLASSSEVLGSPKMAELAAELKSRYPDRIVIYDMPPLLSQDDAMVFMPNVDGVLLVVRDGVTTAEDLKQCMYTLAETPVIGTVLNRAFAAA